MESHSDGFIDVHLRVGCRQGIAATGAQLKPNLFATWATKFQMNFKLLSFLSKYQLVERVKMSESSLVQSIWTPPLDGAKEDATSEQL